MSSLVTHMLVVERYGLRLSLKQLEEIVGLKEGTIRNQIAARTFKIVTYKDGAGRWADARDVAAYLDKCREDAVREAERRKW